MPVTDGIADGTKGWGEVKQILNSGSKAQNQLKRKNGKTILEGLFDRENTAEAESEILRLVAEIVANSSPIL